MHSTAALHEIARGSRLERAAKVKGVDRISWNPKYARFVLVLHDARHSRESDAIIRELNSIIGLDLGSTITFTNDAERLLEIHLRPVKNMIPVKLWTPKKTP